MVIGTDDIRKLRDATGVSVMHCKKALEEADGTFDKALIILRKQSSGIAAKKSERTLGAGTIAAYVHAGGSVATLVALACETDFVAKNEEFKKLAYDIAMHATAMNPEFLKRDDIGEDAKKTAQEVFEKEVIGKPEELKERILSGKLDAYFKDKILLEQQFIKNPELSIGELLEQAVQKFGERIEVMRFVRLVI